MSHQLAASIYDGDCAAMFGFQNPAATHQRQGFGLEGCGHERDFKEAKGCAAGRWAYAENEYVARLRRIFANNPSGASQPVQRNNPDLLNAIRFRIQSSVATAGGAHLLINPSVA